jgi:hypothetical protein
MQKGFIQLTLSGYIITGLTVALLISAAMLKIQSSRLEACKSEFQVFKSEVERLGKEAQVKVNKEIERQKKVTNDVSSDYEKRLNYLRDTYNRLRDQRSSGNGLPPIPNAPRSVDEIPPDSIPLAGICAETTQQLVSLQEWVKAQSQ